jgi:hypothetical protein
VLSGGVDVVDGIEHRERMGWDGMVVVDGIKHREAARPRQSDSRFSIPSSMLNSILDAVLYALCAASKRSRGCVVVDGEAADGMVWMVKPRGCIVAACSIPSAASCMLIFVLMHFAALLLHFLLARHIQICLSQEKRSKNDFCAISVRFLCVNAAAE